MTTLKEHEAILRELKASSPFSNFMASALIDILAHLNATTAPNNNDAMLAQDLKACASQNASERARIRELELLLRHQTQQRLTLESTVRDLRKTVNYWRKKAEQLPEQAGCRKQDTQVQDDGWVEWDSGPFRPANDKAYVNVRFKSGGESEGFVDEFYWTHPGLGGDIIAYRVVKP